jgi:HD-like signal output (HDOD) protein
MSCDLLFSDDDLDPLRSAGEPDRGPTFATILARVKPFPTVVQQVRAVASSPQSTVADVARALEQDVGLTADVLRLVNAPTSGLAQRCTSLRHAVALLGLDRVGSVVAAAAALGFVESTAGLAPAVAAHALAVAGVARMLASYTGVSPDEAFVAGLLHDVGVMLLLQNGDALYEELVEQASGADVDIEDERALLGFDHAAAGAYAIRAWALPAPLPEAALLHHDWDAAVERGGATLALVAVVRTADILVPHLLAHESPRPEDLDIVRSDAAFECIGLTREELYNMWTGLRLACSKANSVGGAREEAAGKASVASEQPRAPDPSVWTWVCVVAVATVVAAVFALQAHF